MQEPTIRDVLDLYNPTNPLERAFTIPAAWYFDHRIQQLERSSVFAANWQVVGRTDQVREPGQFFTIDVNEEPLVVVRSDDGHVRAFFNVCRHHAAAVVPQESGCAKQFRCPYHGWTYGNDGTLKGMVEFEGVCNFNRSDNGLVPVRVDTWENFIFANLGGNAAPLRDFLGKVPELVAPLQLAGKLHFFDRRIYTLNCNWKVYSAASLSTPSTPLRISSAVACSLVHWILRRPLITPSVQHARATLSTYGSIPIS
jgi:choline monooxygenase